MEEKIRKYILVGGMVQGVGFRWFARQCAESCHLTGWVSNLDDGRVELEVQENAFFNAVIVMYGLPFIGFIVGIVLGYFGVPKLIPNISPVLPSLVLGVLGIVLAMLWIHSQNHRWESGKYRPLATKIVEEDEPEMCGA